MHKRSGGQGLFVRGGTVPRGFVVAAQIVTSIKSQGPPLSSADPFITNYRTTNQFHIDRLRPPPFLPFAAGCRTEAYGKSGPMRERFKKLRLRGTAGKLDVSRNRGNRQNAAALPWHVFAADLNALTANRPKAILPGKDLPSVGSSPFCQDLHPSTWIYLHTFLIS